MYIFCYNLQHARYLTVFVAVCRGRYVASMSDARALKDCVIVNGDLAIQLSGNSK